MNYKRLSVAGLAATLLCTLFLFSRNSDGLAQTSGTQARVKGCCSQSSSGGLSDCVPPSNGSCPGGKISANCNVNSSGGLSNCTAAARRNGTAEVQTITITGNTIASLPAGKNFIVKARKNTLQLGSTGNARLNKQGSGDVILSGSNASTASGPILSGPILVYEFRSDAQPIDFSRVVVQEGESTEYVGLEAWLRKHRPASGMRGWPFKRLLIGPAEGIAKVEGWKIKDGTPGTEYECDGGPEVGIYCGCTGALDCTLLVLSGNCTSELTCGDGQCFCDAD